MASKRKTKANEVARVERNGGRALTSAPGRAEVDRKTRETQVAISLRLDGSGVGEAHTGVPFLDHMLESFARHGFFDLKVEASGDLHIDEHHTVEDVGIVMGRAFRQ